jgi:hypothetical protein
MANDLDPPGDPSSRGDGAARVPLSEVITAARLESCAGALRNASGEAGDQPDMLTGE